jgi:hypothetical protein
VLRTAIDEEDATDVVALDDFSSEVLDIVEGSEVLDEVKLVLETDKTEPFEAGDEKDGDVELNRWGKI